MFWKWKKDQTAQPTEKERQKAEKLHRDKMRIEYDMALQQIDTILSRAENDEVRIAILDYAIKAVKRDLIGEELADCGTDDFRFALLCDLAAMKRDREKR